jgi:adenosylcobinamide-phosphate synthase
MPNRLHPVVLMGRSTRWLRDLGFRLGKVSQLLFGAAMALLLPCLFAAATWALLFALGAWPWLQAVAAVFLLKSSFAVRELGRAAGRVGLALAQSDVAKARYELRCLCSRDASQLDEEQLASATIASVAENLSDSFVAPLFYFVVGGVPGAVFYRVVNTMDAIVGYRGRLEYLGKAAARLDDLLNIVPARLTALLLLLAGLLCRMNVRFGLAVLRRDRRLTPSPNGGWPMAAMAGLLGIQIIKIDHYVLGDAGQPPSAATIDAAWRVALVAAVLALAAAVAVVLAWGGIFGLRS